MIGVRSGGHNPLLSTEAYQDFGARLQTAKWRLDAHGLAYRDDKFDCAQILHSLAGEGNFFYELNVDRKEKGRVIGVAVVRVAGDSDEDAAARYEVFWTNSGNGNNAEGADSITISQHELHKRQQRASSKVPRPEGHDIKWWRVRSTSGADGNPENINAHHNVLNFCQQVYAGATAQGRPEEFCFRSHPFSQHKFVRDRPSYSDEEVGFGYKYDLDSSQSVTANCVCAGTKLATYLRMRGWFQRPTGAPANQADNNARVMCMAERSSVKRSLHEVNFGKPDPSELGGNSVHLYYVAHSCTTCQVMMQLVYGNEMLPSSQCKGPEPLIDALGEGLEAMENDHALAIRSLSVTRRPKHVWADSPTANPLTCPLPPPIYIEVLTSDEGSGSAAEDIDTKPLSNSKLKFVQTTCNTLRSMSNKLHCSEVAEDKSATQF